MMSTFNGDLTAIAHSIINHKGVKGTSMSGIDCNKKSEDSTVGSTVFDTPVKFYPAPNMDQNDECKGATLKAQGEKYVYTYRRLEFGPQSPEANSDPKLNSVTISRMESCISKININRGSEEDITEEQEN
uniref:Reverse transcriptase domain-containing protein n=1 Tax=Rhabditophanes sp. KR3021 TaxID=114890 RepID=A0AC35U1J7_9BILA